MGQKSRKGGGKEGEESAGAKALGRLRLLSKLTALSLETAHVLCAWWGQKSLCPQSEDLTAFFEPVSSP